MEIKQGMSERLLDMIMDYPEWMAQGSCLEDEDIDPTYLSDSAKMLKMCKTCPVLDQCNEKFSSVNEERKITNGVFGGVNYNKKG